MAAPALGVVAKKAAVMLLTDKRTWTVIGAIIVGFILLCLLPALVLMNMFGGVNDVDIGKTLEEIDRQKIIETLTPEELEQFTKLETALNSIEDEIEKQSVDIDPLKPQIIFVYALSDRIDDENIYTNFISCFANADDDSKIFDNICAKFGIEISTEERQNILLAYEEAKNAPEI